MSRVQINRGFFYFFEVNTKYISSNVLKISVISRVKLLILSTHEMKYFLYLPKKSKFSFYLRGKLNFFHSHFSLISLGSACLVGIIQGVNTVFTYKMGYNFILMNG